MFPFLEQRFGKLKEIVGIEIRISSNESLEINWMHLRQIKGAIQVISSQSGIKDLNELKNQLPPSIPISLTLDGKGILHKKVEGSPTNDLKLLLERAFPSGKLEDFYVQPFPGHGGTWTSVARRSFVDELLSNLKNIGVNPICLSFGIFPLVNVTLLLNTSISNFKGQLGFYDTQISNGLLENISLANESENTVFPHIPDTELTHANASAFASAFQNFLPDQIQVQLDSITLNRSEIVQKNVFTTLGWGVLLFFLGVLMINYLLFQFFHSQNELLKQKESLYAGNLDELSKLNSSITEKEGFLEKTGWNSSSKLSFYSDKIASTVPAEISLSTLELYPVTMSTINSKKEVRINSNEIILKGSSSNPTVLNNWVLQLKYFDWIKSIKVVDYQFESSKRVGIFSLQMELN